MNNWLKSLRVLCFALCLGAGIAGCVVSPPPVANLASPFDRSWEAVVGAFADEMVQVTQHDRATGTVAGRVGETLVSAAVLTQADGSVKVEFGVSGNVAANPTLKDRIVRSYSRRMGR